MCKVDGLLLDYFCCLLPYTTWICDVGIFVHPQIRPGSIPKGFGVNLELLCIIKVYWQWAIRRPHRSPSSMLTIEPRMMRSIEHVGQLLLKTCCQIKLNNRVRPIHLSEIFISQCGFTLPLFLTSNPWRHLWLFLVTCCLPFSVSHSWNALST